MAYDDLYVKGTNSHDDAQILELVLRDSATGMGKTGLTSTGVTCYWVQQGDASATALTLSSGTVGMYVDSSGSGTGGGFVAVDGTNAPGVYQLSLADAMLATSASKNALTIHLKGTGVIDAIKRILLVGADLRNATNLGLTDIDATISSRLASTGYTAPSATVVLSSSQPNYAPLLSTAYTAPDNATITAINAKTTNLSTAPASVGSQMDLVDAPNATAIAAFTTNINASWAIQAILSNARGKVTKVGNAYSFYSTDNTTVLHTLTFSTTSSDRTVSSS